MKFAIIALISAVLFTNSMALAQKVSTGSATTSDAAVSPATSNPGNVSSRDNNGPGAGIASGAMNNGTTGDTIGTGHGTPAAPATGTTTTPAPDNHR
jgi:hypothetical protein